MSTLGNGLKSEGFEGLLYSTVISGLKDVMGTSGLVATKYHLKLDERNFDVNKFHDGLNNMFHVGSGAIENVILQLLYNDLGAPFKERGGYEFPQYVELARKIYLEKVKRNKRAETE